MLNQPLKIEQKELLITAVLSGDCSIDDLKKHEYLLKSDNEYAELFVHYKKIWLKIVENNDIPLINVDEEWGNLKRKLFNKATPAVNQNVFVKYKQLWRIAAILVLGLFIAFSYYYLHKPSTTELIAKIDNLNTQLPDGSEIVLCHTSKITYSKGFSRKHRTLNLDGSAYFKVKADTVKPFTVCTDMATIEVVGTAFYVNQNKQQNKVEVIVESGIVAVYPVGNRQDKILLSVGESVTVNGADQKMEKIIQPDINATSWHTKVFAFKDEELQNVVVKINSVYHSNIVVENEALKHCKVTVNFNNQNIESIIKILQEILDLTVKKEKNTIVLSGKNCGY